jgi:hypothetical protein
VRTLAVCTVLALTVASSASGANGSAPTGEQAADAPGGPTLGALVTPSLGTERSTGHAAVRHAVVPATGSQASLVADRLATDVVRRGLPNAGAVAAALQVTPSVQSALAPSSSAATLLENGTFDAGTAGWFAAHLADDTTIVVAEDSGDRVLEVTATKTEGSVAQDVSVPVEAGRRYAASVRAVSPSGLPVLVELAVHALNADGSLGETNHRLVMVEDQEVPITATLIPNSNHASLLVEVYVHTVDRPVRIDDAKLVVDGDHHGPNNYGYQQPRVRYLDGVDLGTLAPGGRYQVEVSVGTTTDQPWSCCVASGAVRLGTEDEDLVGGSSRPSQLHTPGTVDGSNWLSENRIAFDRSHSTLGGTFTTVITAPTALGPFAERFRLVAEDVSWMPGPVIEIIGSVTETPATDQPVEAPGSDVDTEADILTECPATTSAAPPDPATSDCVARIDGFDVEVANVDTGAFTVRWQRPAAVAVDFYLVEVQDLNITDAETREREAQELETGQRTLVVDVEPGRYGVRVISLDENGQWVRGDDVEVNVPAPVTEAEIPPVGCPPAPVTGGGFPVPCTPVPEPDSPLPDTPLPDNPATDTPNPDDEAASADCAPLVVDFERNMLMRYRGSNLTSRTVVDLTCSRYVIDLRSSDPRHSVDYQPDQTGEQWYLQGLNAAGAVIYTSPTTPDLGPNRTESVMRVGPVDLDGVVAFRGRHLGRGESPNSVTVQATLTAVS